LRDAFADQPISPSDALTPHLAAKKNPGINPGFYRDA